VVSGCRCYEEGVEAAAGMVSERCAVQRRHSQGTMTADRKQGARSGRGGCCGGQRAAVTGRRRLEHMEDPRYAAAFQA